MEYRKATGMACIAMQARPGSGRDKAVSMYNGMIAAAIASRADVWSATLDNARGEYEKRKQEIFAEKAKIEKMGIDERNNYRREKALAAYQAATAAKMAAAGSLSDAQETLARLEASEPKIMVRGRMVSAVNMVDKLASLKKKYDAKKATQAAAAAAGVDARVKLDTLQAAASAAASTAAAAIAMAATYPNYTTAKQTAAAAAAWNKYYIQLDTVRRYYDTAYNATIGAAEKDMQSLAAEIGRISPVISDCRTSIATHKALIKKAKTRVHRAKVALDEATNNEMESYVTYLGYTADSWDIYKLSLDNADYAAAYLRLCEIIAYQAIKARVISANAAIAKSKVVNDKSKNHKQAFFEFACNAGCDKRLLDILASFGWDPIGDKAQNIISAIYTGLADCYDRSSDRQKAAVPMFIAGMRLGWKEIERERGARVKIGTREDESGKKKPVRQRIINTPLDSISDIYTGRASGVRRPVEDEVEYLILMDDIENFIDNNIEHLKDSHIELLNSVKNGVSLVEYAKTTGKTQPYYSKMLGDIQRALSKADADEHGKNRRVATYLNFLDYFQRKNRYA